MTSRQDYYELLEADFLEKKDGMYSRWAGFLIKEQDFQLKMHADLTALRARNEALERVAEQMAMALRRAHPQVKGVLVIQDVGNALAAYEKLNTAGDVVGKVGT